MSLVIPPDLASWPPEDVTEWLSTVNEDESYTDEEVFTAQKAVENALLGEEEFPEDSEDGDYVASLEQWDLTRHEL